MTINLYEQLGLTPEETEVYTIVVSKLVRTIEEISILARDLTPEAIQGALIELEKKKFVRVVPGKVPQYIALAPTITVTSEIDRRIENELNQIQEEIKNRWKTGQKELGIIVNEFQKGPEIFTDYENHLKFHFQDLSDQVKAKSTSIQQQLKDDIRIQNQENTKQFEELISKFATKLETDVQENITSLETSLQTIKDAQTSQRDRFIEKISKIYTEKIDSLNNLFSQMTDSVQKLQQQVSNAEGNLNSSLISLNDQISQDIEEKKKSHREDLKSIGEEISNKIKDKLIIIDQQIEAVQKDLINSSEELLKTMNAMVHNFSDQTSQNTLSFSEDANLIAENFWNQFQKMLQSFANTITRLDETKGKISSSDMISVVTETLNEAKEGIIRGLAALDKAHTDGLSRLNTDIKAHLSSFHERMIEDTSQTFEKMVRNIQEQYDSGMEKFQELVTEVSALLDNEKNSLVQESSETTKRIIQDLQKQNQVLQENTSSLFSKVKEKVIEIEKTIVEDSELNLVDVSTNLDELNLKMKEFQSERSDKLSESLQYLRNVANEEFSSFGASSNMMLGQMQSTLTENVSARVEEISQRFSVLNYISDHLNQVSNNIRDEISKISDQLNSSKVANNQTISEAFDQDVANLEIDVKTVSEAAKKEESERAAAAAELLSTLRGNFEKITLELSRNIPTQLEEYQARHTDDFNTFDRAVKAELNKIRSRLTEINTEVKERLGKRVSLGKRGFQDIANILTQAFDEFESAQNRTERLIDDQIRNFEAANESLAENINSKLRGLKREVKKLLNDIKDDLSESTKRTYDLAIKNILNFAQFARENIISRKNQTIEQFALLVSTVSSSLSVQLNQILMQEFEEMNSNLQKLTQVAQAPYELQTLISSEVENFIQNLQLAFQTASESGAKAIINVINESISAELTRTFESFKSQFDLSSLKETLSSHWKASTHKVSSGLSQLAEDTHNDSTQLLESAKTSVENLILRIEEASQNLERVIEENIQTWSSNHLEKIQTIPSNLEDRKKDILVILQEAQQNLQKVSDSSIKIVVESLKEIFSQITESREELLQEIRSIPSQIEEKRTHSIETIETQYQATFRTIEEIRSASLDHLSRMEQQASNQRSEFTNQVNQLKTSIENEFSNLRSFIAEQDESFPDKTAEIKQEIQEITKIFSTNVKDMFDKLETEFNSSKNQLDQKIERFHQDFQKTLETFLSASKSFVTSLNSKYSNVLDQTHDFLAESKVNSKEALELEKKAIADLHQQLFTEVDQNLTTFSIQFGQVITDSLEGISNDFKDNIKGIEKLIIKVSTPYYGTFNTLFTETLSFFDSESEKGSKFLEQKVSDLKSEVNKKAISLQDTISSDLSQIIGTIPDNVSDLIKSKDLMSAITQVQNLAMEIPIASMEETYLQTQRINQVIQTLEAMLNRTKSTLQIMVPKLSMIPWDVLKKAGTRRRIQILTEVDDPQAKKIMEELGNVQLKHYDRVEVFAFARDGNEEAAIGSGEGESVQLIITTDSQLVGVLKEIIQDLWPRGKTV